MVQAAWTWAANTQNIRRSCVHGEEEARLVLTDSFEANDVTSHETSMQGAIEMQETIRIHQFITTISQPQA